MIKYPQALKFHKKSAEMQLNLLRPKDVEEGEKVRTESGCIFLDIAKPKGDGTSHMDWANKITMKLSSRDIAQLVMGIRVEKKADLIHRVEKPDGTFSQTTLKVEPGERDTFKWFIAKSLGTESKNTTIFLDRQDMYLAFNMLEAVVPVIHGWSD